MKNLIYISLLAILMTACGSNKNQVEPIQLEIPEVLMDNAEARELIEDMTDAINSIRESMAEGVQFALENDKSGTDSLTFWQGIKAGKMALKMMRSAEKVEKVRQEVQLLKPNLSEMEWMALEEKINELEAMVGDINPEAMGLSEEDIAKLKAEEELHIGEKEIDTVAEQQGLEDAMELREMEESQMQSANLTNETPISQTNDESGSGWLALLFIVLVFALIIFGFVRKIKLAKRRLKNVSNDFFHIKDQFNNKN